MTRSRPRPPTTLMVVLAAVAAVLFGLVSPASAAAPYCGITWGSLPKSQEAKDTEFITDVRAGRHACFDRLVVDLNGGDNSFGSYAVRYVPRITADGSGDVVPVRGGAILEVVVKAPTYDMDGVPTYDPRNRADVVDVRNFSTFRQVALAVSFEGQTQFGLGVRARLPYRVFYLAGAPWSDQGPRLVIDVAHHW